MIKLTDKDKTLVVPAGLGNFGQSAGSGGGVTPEEAAQIASAVTAEALDEYDTELQVDLEEIREAVSANTGTLLDLSQIAVMTVADRVALFDEIHDKAASGEKVYIKGLVQEETIRTAILPLVSYRPETNPVLHQGGYLYFAAKGDTDNIYFHVALSSEGAIDPTSSTFIKRNIYTLPTASSEVKGGVKVGSGLLMTQDTLSLDTTGIVTDGDLAPFIVQLSGNTEDISELSGVTSALTQTVAGKQDTLTAGNGIDLSGSTISVKIGDGLGFSGDTLVVSGGTGGGPAVYYLDKMTQQERVALYNEIQSYTEQTFPAGDYRFFTYMVDNDEYQGNIELCVARFYDETPVSFSGIYQSRYSSQVLQRGYELASNGDFELTFEAKVNINKPEPKRYVLNLMTQEERAALYTELSAYRYSYASVSSSFPVWDYSFYYWVGDQGSDPYNDKFSGFVPLDIALLHPGDYGGAVFFTGIVKTRSDGSTVIAVRYNMASDGSVEVFSNAISQ